MGKPKRKPLDFRKIIRRELATQKKSRYWLAQQVASGVSRTAVYDYLRGDSDISSESVGALLSVLEIDVETPA